MLWGPEGSALDRHEVTGQRSWPSGGSDARQAEAGLPTETVALLATSRALGASYGRRIAPVWTTETRVVFVAGDPVLAGLRMMVLAGDWRGAEHRWREVLADAALGERVRGRAAHSLSVTTEMRGDLFGAQQMARQAVALWAHGTSRTQLEQVSERLAEAQAR